MGYVTLLTSRGFAVLISFDLSNNNTSRPWILTCIYTKRLIHSRKSQVVLNKNTWKEIIYFSLLIKKIFEHLKMINLKYFNQKVLDVSKPLQLKMESDNDMVCAKNNDLEHYQG